MAAGGGVPGGQPSGGNCGGRNLIAIRHLHPSELRRIGEVDRSEHVTQEYAYRHGALEARAVNVHVGPWSLSGEGEHSVRRRIADWQPILARGGLLLGAFDGDALAGFAIYRPRIGDGVANLAALFVSRSHRRRGIASQLTRETARLARASGARRLYVSATPSGSAVGLYRSHGFAPTDEPDPVLFALEPADIHMILELDGST
jgi:ribosomal protein S18 acetylase RimI-like enzyme